MNTTMTPMGTLLKARKEIIRTGKLMFFGTILHDVNLIVTDMADATPIPTMATDGNNIWANPQFIQEHTFGEMKGVLVHEVLHISNCHHLRRGNRDPELWNEACDYAINPIVLAAGMLLPKDGLIDQQYAEKSAEQIYNLLKKKRGEARTQSALSISMGGHGNPSPQEAPQGSQQTEAGSPSQSSSTGSGKPAKPRAGLLLEPTGETNREQEARIRVKVIQGARLSEISNIVLPEGVDKIVQEAKKPLVDWKDRLREFVTQSCETPVDRTWSKPNRRALAMNMYLPGWRKEDAGHLVIVKDTSGSIDDAPNAQFDAEIKRIIEDVRPQRVTTIASDNKVRHVGEFPQGMEVTLSSLGGGGTDFKPAINYINGMATKPNAVIYFTDLKCYRYGVPDGYPVMWVQWGNHPVMPPYGEVVKINE